MSNRSVVVVVVSVVYVAKEGLTGIRISVLLCLSFQCEYHRASNY